MSQTFTVQGSLHLQGIVCRAVWRVVFVKISLPLKGTVCNVHSRQGSMDLHGNTVWNCTVCRVVWRVVCTYRAQYAQCAVCTCSMDHWRGETLAGGATYLMAGATSHQQ